MKAYQLLIPILLLNLLALSCSADDVQSRESSFFPEKDPEEVGISRALVDKLKAKSAQLPNIYSFLLVKDKALIAEEYYNGANSETLLHLRSITKSVSSIMIGKALEEGLFEDLEEKLVDYYAEYIDAQRSDPIDKISLNHILNMQTGFSWNENTEAINWYTTTQNTWGYIFSKEVSNEPGSIFNYNSASVSLLNRFIESNQPLSLDHFTSEKLFSPLGITRFAWEKDGLGNTRADAGLQLRARDLAKIGVIMNQEGFYNDQPVIPQQWITESWKFEIDLQSTYGPIQSLHYNKLWWMGRYQEHTIFFGLGYGGQLLICVPESDLVIVANHEFRLPANVVSRHSTDFLNHVLIPVLDEL